MKFKKQHDFGDFVLINFTELNKKEKDSIREWRNSETVRKWMYSDSLISPEEHTQFINSLKLDTKNCYWLVSNKKEEHIGVIYLNKIDFRNKNAYLGIYNNPNCKLKNRGSILINLIIELSFSLYELHTLKLEVIENNERAINFYKKAGFIQEGRLKEFVLKNGSWHDVIVMGLTNDKEIPI
ncbi:UDP-4-amino-4,6-dideoxy-N-acetyl-beta-L-altrosamine N-acetyltransferase [Methanohalophilus profundi]|uniref:UDP-4-amino-4, 6-dideoxy-N-acetyl-beta-L-altrosamine N-acetyltransferase n=1 Tax=Methanohalophilus profundi TaxID=2138083 RepID=UPI00101C0802|nr:UDP-4-amino-4,6-dideoxy-N-acetyl-beta-L-altrosamine N-acetyltransferase [Methanohalophilus profundi]